MILLEIIHAIRLVLHCCDKEQNKQLELRFDNTHHFRLGDWGEGFFFRMSRELLFGSCCFFGSCYSSFTRRRALLLAGYGVADLKIFLDLHQPRAFCVHGHTQSVFLEFEKPIPQPGIHAN